MTVAIAAQKPIHETHRVQLDGAVDADGHILEPPDLWETYIDPQFRDRALRVVVDENGLEELEIGGRPAPPRPRGRGDPLPDGRSLGGGRRPRPAARPGVHEGLQPLDLRVLRRRAA